MNNHEQIVELLRHCASSEQDAEISLLAAGLLAKVNTMQFVFICKFVHGLLHALEPANNSLQSKSMDLLTASDVINTVLQMVKDMRDEHKFEQLFTSVFGNERDETDSAQKPLRVTGKRKVICPAWLDDFVIVEHVETRSDLSPRLEMIGLYNSIIDRCVTEIETRFSASNVALLKSLRALTCLNSEQFMNPLELESLANLCDVDLKKSAAELEAAKLFFLRKNNENTGCLQSLHKLALFCHSYRDAFPDTYRIIAAGLTIGASSSTCEATFSTLTRVLTPYRRSMLHERKANLILLSYEYEITSKIDNEDFFKRFNNVKSRRLQLF